MSDNWQETAQAVKRMHSATDNELVDLLAAIPHKLFCDIMRSHLNEYSNKREHLNNSASIQLRQHAMDYFLAKEQEK